MQNVERFSRLHPSSCITEDLLTQLRDFAACVVLDKLHYHLEDMEMIAPMGNDARPACLFNTKISVQFARCSVNAGERAHPVVMQCCACSPERPTETDHVAGGYFTCPDCKVNFTRKYTYGIGSGRSSINAQHLKVLDFTPAMEQLVRTYEQESGGCEHYTNITLVIYCGADFCANCALGLEHGAKKCATTLGGHRDNGGGGNTQAEYSMGRTLSVGATRYLTMELLHESDDCSWTSIPETAVDFQLVDGSEFRLDTNDEKVRLCRISSDGGERRCAWFHGMVTPIQDDKISCGFVARHVSNVTDVCCDHDIVIERSKRTQKHDTAERRWREEWAPLYRERTGTLVHRAVQSWSERSCKEVAALRVLSSTLGLSASQ